VLNVDTAADTYTLGSTIATGEVLGMEVAAGRVFALDKAGSIAVIDAATDEKLTTFGTSMLGLAQSADGNIWAAQEKKLYCYDPSTLATLREVDITSATFYSKGAGYPDNLCASPNENVLFWRDKNGNIYRFDLSDDAPATLTSVSGIYSALNYDVKSDQLIVGVGSYVMTGNSVVFINATTGETSAFEMPDYFWFTSTAVTTDKYAPEFTATSVECSVAEWNQPFTVSLADYVTDRDNNDNNITFELDGADSISSDDIATVTLQGKTLTVTPIAAGTVSARVKAVSNGRVTTQTFDLVLSGLSDGVETVVTAGRDISVDGDVVTFSGYDGSLAVVYGLSGQAVRTALVDGDRFEARFGLPAGVYFVKAGNGPAKKIIIR
jgi:hypothetical protein